MTSRLWRARNKKEQLYGQWYICPHDGSRKRYPTQTQILADAKAMQAELVKTGRTFTDAKGKTVTLDEKPPKKTKTAPTSTAAPAQEEPATMKEVPHHPLNISVTEIEPPAAPPTPAPAPAPEPAPGNTGSSAPAVAPGNTGALPAPGTTAPGAPAGSTGPGTDAAAAMAMDAAAVAGSAPAPAGAAQVATQAETVGIDSIMSPAEIREQAAGMIDLALTMLEKVAHFVAALKWKGKRKLGPMAESDKATFKAVALPKACEMVTSAPVNPWVLIAGAGAACVMGMVQNAQPTNARDPAAPPFDQTRPYSPRSETSPFTTDDSGPPAAPPEPRSNITPIRPPVES